MMKFIREEAWGSLYYLKIHLLIVKLLIAKMISVWLTKILR